MGKQVSVRGEHPLASRLLGPELIHAGKGAGVFDLEAMPIIEIGLRPVCGEKLRVAAQDMGF